LIIKLIGSRI